MTSSSAPLPPRESGWACLFRDVLFDIFLRAGHREVLQGAGLVRAAWWRLARHEPALWRRIDLTAAPDADDIFIPGWLFDGDDAEDCDKIIMGWKEMARAAVDRSAGQCEVFCGRGDGDVLLYLADRAPSLKRLCITSYYDLSSKVFVKLITRFPLLEELELVLKFDGSNDIYSHIRPPANCWAGLLQATCKACSHLNSFSVRHAGTGSHYPQRGSTFVHEFAIPTMHELCSLQLFGNSFTRDVVLHIIDACPNLHFLDISELHSQSRRDDELRDKCSRINNLFLPFPSFI